MKEVFKPIEYEGKTYNICFNLNVMEVIQEEYGTLDHWGDITDGKAIDPKTKKPKNEIDVKALIFGFREMLNEAIEIENEKNGTNEPLLTRKQAGRIISALGMENITDTMNDLVIESSGSSEEKNG